MWDIGSGECLHVLVGHVAAVRCVQYDGRLVVSGAYDYMVKVTDSPLGNSDYDVFFIENAKGALV
jgi:hypothetical protein